VTVKVSEALATRMSCRAFLPAPVPEATVRTILDAARQAPSGGNLQPWHVCALAGAPLADLIAHVKSQMRVHPRGETPEYDIYPAALWEPYRSRRYKCGEDLYATIGVKREDKLGRLLQFARNYEFFGAPVGLLFFLDRRLGPPQWSDVGMFMQSVMLLAREHGLHTCAQEAWSLWHGSVREFLGMPQELLLFSGMALGWRDESAPINTLRTDRAPIEEFASLRGF
jgi:nitroreductase